MSGADELDEAIALANSGRTRPATPPVPRLKRIRRIQWSDSDQEEPEGAEEAALPRDRADDGTGEPPAEPSGEASPGAGFAGGAARRRERTGERNRDGASERAQEGAQEGPPEGSHQGPHAQELPSWSRARALAAGTPRALPRTTLPLDRALGHTLAASLEALTDLPSFDTSAMDGWAVSGPGPWELTPGPGGAEAPGVLAGDGAEPAPLPDGHAVRIATGARIPPGASAVLRTEYGETPTASRLRTARAPQPGTDIRPRGQECRSGDELLPGGTHVTPAVLGLAAAAGYDELDVVRRPRAEVLVLGDELLHRGLPRDGRIRDALGPLAGPWLTALGADVIVTRRLGDDPEALYEALATTTADVVVTTGSTASGPVDHLQPTLRRLGAHLLVQGVRVRPGHPMLLAALPGPRPDAGTGAAEDSQDRRDNRDSRDSQSSQSSRDSQDSQAGQDDVRAGSGPYLVGLPGNPLAALSGLVTLAAPLLRTLGGRPGPGREQQGTLAEEVHGHPRDTRLVPVAHEGVGIRARVRPLRFAGPSMLRGIAAADALAVVPPGGAAPGTDVRLLELPR